MDENAISTLCCIGGCEWRVVGDDKCPQHGGLPTYAWEPSIWGDDREFVAADLGPLVTTTTERGTNGTATR